MAIPPIPPIPPIKDHTKLANIGSNTHSDIDSHIGSTANPHSVTAAQASAVALSGDTMTGTLNSRSIIPTADFTYDLGSSNYAFKGLYVNDPLGYIKQDMSAIANFAAGGFPFDIGAYPTTANADDVEFNDSVQAHNNTIGSIAGGDFWEWSVSPTNNYINSATYGVPNCLKVGCSGTLGGDAVLHGDLTAIDWSGTSSLPCRVFALLGGMACNGSNHEMMAFGMLDVSTGYYIEAVVQSNLAATPLVTIEAWYDIGGGRTQNGTTITLGYFIPFAWVKCDLYSSTNHTCKIAFSMTTKNTGSTIAQQNMGSGFEPDRIYFKFGKNDGPTSGFQNSYYVDYLRRTGP